MSKRQCELDCNSTTISSVGLVDVFSPKKRNNLSCSRSFREAKEIELQLPCKNKRPVTICLSQCTKVKKQPPLSPLSLEGKCPISDDGPTRINDFIFLGSQLDASSESTLQRCGITHVLNATTTSPRCPHVTDVNFFRVPVDDGMYDKLLPHFDEVFHFIDGTRNSGGSVLVHCVAGISRSATLVIGYLMHRSGLSFNEAYRFVKQKRPNIAPNFNFLGQLMEFENYLLLKQQQQQQLQQHQHQQQQQQQHRSQEPSICLQNLSRISNDDDDDDDDDDVTPRPANADEKFFSTPAMIGQHHHHHHQGRGRISPGDEFLAELSCRCRCRTDSNQSTSGSHETSTPTAQEILQVS